MVNIFQTQDLYENQSSQADLFKGSVKPSQVGVQGLRSKCLEVATRAVLLKKLFLKILQNSQDNTCASVF